MDDSQYAAMVRPSTYANPTLLETLMAEFRANDPLPFIQSDSHKPLLYRYQAR